VQEKEPALAVSLLSMVKGWVGNMKNDGETIQVRYKELQESVHSLIQRAQLSKTFADRRLAEALHAEIAGGPPLSPQTEQRLAITALPGMGDSVVTTAAVLTNGTISQDSPIAAPSPARASGGGIPMSFAPSLAPAVEAKSVAKAPPLPVSMNSWTQQLFDQLTHLQEAGVGAEGHSIARNEEGGGIDEEAWKRDVLELLFMAPGVHEARLGNARPSQLPPPRLESVTTPGPVMEAHGERKVTDPSPSLRKEDSEAPAAAMPSVFEPDPLASGPESVAIVLHEPSSATATATAEAMTQSSMSLIRALRELKRVDEILLGCSAFWANMDGTVQKLAQMKEHTECLVQFAGNSKALRERFDHRLTEYTNFWSSLERLCRQYCVDHQAASKQMYEMIREVTDAKDVLDHAQMTRLVMMLKDRQNATRRTSNVAEVE